MAKNDLVPTKVTVQRVQAVLDDEGLHYLRNDKEHFAVLFFPNIIALAILEGPMTFIARWHRGFAVERAWDVATICRQVNAQRVGPKMTTTVQDNGQLQVVITWSAMTLAGMTDAQLKHEITMAFAIINQLFDMLETEFPDPLLTYEEGE